MKRMRIAAVLAWVYCAAFGLPAVPVAAYVLQRGELPWFMGLFPMYGGPWSERVSDGRLITLLFLFLVVLIGAAWTARLTWNGSRRGIIASLALLPIEAVCWIGFALPFPWLIGMARAGLLIAALRSPTSPEPATT